jgi:putative aldouronate transport system substrate-binding protein
MKKFKKSISSLLTVCMAMSLAACGGGANQPANPTSSEKTGNTPSASSGSSTTASKFVAGEQFYSETPVSYSMFYSDHENYPLKEDWLLWDQITKLTNVSFDITTAARTDFEQKRTLLLTTGQAPLIIPKTYPGQEIPFIASGAVLPVSDYLDYMPNFKEKIEKWDMEKDLNSIRQGDGKYYVLPGLHESSGGGYTYLIRKDIFDKAGVSINEATYTYEDFYQDMKKVKALDPSKYVLSDRFEGKSMLNIAATAYGVTAGWGKGSGTKFDFDKEEFFFAPTTDNYREFLRYFNKLVKEGILDPESFIQTDDQAIAKFTTGDSFVMSSNVQTAQDMISKLNETLGKDQYEVYMITQPGGPAGQIKMESSRLENGVIINSDALKMGEAEFEKFMNFVDWLWYSDAGQELVKWGVEGETFTVENGKRALKSDIYYNGVNPDATKKLNVDFGFSGGVFAYGGSLDLRTSMFSDFEKDFFDRTVALRTPRKIDPPIMSTEDQIEMNNLISTPLMDYVDQMTLKFILGDANIETEWDAYVKECEAKGYAKFIDNVNQIYKDTKHLLK